MIREYSWLSTLWTKSTLDCSLVNYCSKTMANKILTNSVLIPIGVPICLENILAMVVLFRCRRMIKMLAINLSITEFCTGFMLCLPDDIVNSCTYKKYLAGPFVVVSLLTITVIFVDRCFFDLRFKVLWNCNKKVSCFYLCVHLDLFIFTHLRYVSRLPFGVRYLLWNLIPDSERANQHHFQAYHANHFALQHFSIYLPIYQCLGSFLQKHCPIFFKRRQWSHPEIIRDNGIFSDMLQSVHYYTGSPRNSLWFYVFWNNPCSISESHAT